MKESLRNEVRAAAERDLLTFIRVVSPERVLGACHEEVISWWEREDRKDHQILLFPRDHMKSALAAYRVAHRLTVSPTLRILYISATSTLAQKQLGFIKNILTSKIYMELWPEHVLPDEGRRAKWTNTEIELDHPKRKEENIRDPSIFTAGLTTTITGLHFDIAVLDDVVVNENAYTEEGRQKVMTQFSLLSSIESGDAEEWVVGTRYHPKDLYAEMLDLKEEIYNEDGEKIGEEPIYEVMQREVEDRGDGTGEFLWPRQRRKDGKWFGFDIKILAKKRGKYLDKAQYRAQYYNDPTDPDSQLISYENFQYYDKKFLSRNKGRWFYKDRVLSLTAAIDFAYSISKKADYTAIVVVGQDFEGNIYVLDIDRFKTDKISDYYKRLLALIVKWDFRKLRAEVTAAQSAIVRELKDNYIRPNGLFLKVEEFRPNRYQGSKEERVNAILQPRYDNLMMYHYKGGYCQVLEEELISRNPPHDDIKDCLASCIEISVRPSQLSYERSARGLGVSREATHSRFGGVRI